MLQRTPSQLVARIAVLENQLALLSVASTPSRPKASPHATMKKPGPGPLPEVLAKAPKRHVAFLFSCKFDYLKL